MKRDLYETDSEDARKYEALARQAGASDTHELADFFRGLRDEKDGGLLAQRDAE